MKEIKLQQDILAQSNKTGVCFGKLNDGRIATTIGGVSAYIIFNDNMFLNTAKFREFNFQKTFDNVLDAKDIIPTGVSINDAKNTLKEFKNDETTAYFNDKLFKYFDNKNKLTYSYYKNMLFVFENDVLVGVVLETLLRK